MRLLSFAEVIAPVSVRSFFDLYWEKRFWHVERNAPGYYDPILSSRCLDDYLQSHQIAAAFMNVIRGGEPVPPAQWAEYVDAPSGESVRMASLHKLFYLLSCGATIAFYGLHQAIPSLAQFCDQVTEELGMRSQVNVYLTPPHSQGVAPHYDTHDVMVLQISGRKRWRLYDSPIELPSPSEPFDSNGFTLPAPSHEFELLEGDALYLPRGVIHDAMTTERTSIHVALGIRPRYWFELMGGLMAHMRADPVWRKALPHRHSSEAEVNRTIGDFKQKLTSMIESLDFESLIEKRKKIDVKEKGYVSSPMTDWLRAEQVRPDSRLCRRTEVEFELERDSKSTIVRTAHQRINIPAFLEPALEMFLQDRPFIVHELRGLLSLSQKVELAAQFVRAGLWMTQI